MLKEKIFLFLSIFYCYKMMVPFFSTMKTGLIETPGYTSAVHPHGHNNQRLLSQMCFFQLVLD